MPGRWGGGGADAMEVDAMGVMLLGVMSLGVMPWGLIQWIVPHFGRERSRVLISYYVFRRRMTRKAQRAAVQGTGRDFNRA